MSEDMNGAPRSDYDVNLEAARMARAEKARLRTMFSDPKRGPSARYAHDMWQPYFKWLIEEKAKGTNPELMQIALGQFFGQAMFHLALQMQRPEDGVRLALNTAMGKVEQCFKKQADNAPLIIPAKSPGLVVAQREIDPKKLKGHGQ